MKNSLLLAAAVTLVAATTVISPQTAQAAPTSPQFEAPFKCRTSRIGDNPRSFAHRTPWELDFATPVGVPILASASGRVVKAEWQTSNGYGNLIVIDHGNEWTSWYAHLDTMQVRPGDQVRRGQQIGTSGKTSALYPNIGPHLHFEVRRGWEYPAAIQPVTFHGKPFPYPNGAVKSANC